MSKAKDIKMLKLLGIDVKAVKRQAKLIQWMMDHGIKFDQQYLETFPPHDRERMRDILVQAKLLAD